MAEAAAQQQAAALARQDIKPFVLGVAWGRTMHLIAEHLLSTPREPRPKDLQVVPIVGITSVLNPEPVEANVIAMDIARAYRGVSAQLPCPAFVDSYEAGLVRQPKVVQQMLKKITECDAVITSMGPIPETPYGAADITLSSDAVMNEELFKSAHSEGAIGEICYWLFNRDGAPLSSKHTAIGLGFEGLRTIARDPKRQVILVTGGDRRRFEPLKVALTAGLASVLVSDTVTARYLIKDA
jgi:DNA-binding transcriptional regulator LsrR (DeoR family)